MSVSGLFKDIQIKFKNHQNGSIGVERIIHTMSSTVVVVVCVAWVEAVVGETVLSCLAFGLAQYISRW